MPYYYKIREEEEKNERNKCNKYLEIEMQNRKAKTASQQFNLFVNTTGSYMNDVCPAFNNVTKKSASVCLIYKKKKQTKRKSKIERKNKRRKEKNWRKLRQSTWKLKLFAFINAVAFSITENSTEILNIKKYENRVL